MPERKGYNLSFTLYYRDRRHNVLSLVRKKGQRIRIYDDKGLDIKVTVKLLRNKRVTLNIDAPKEIKIDREEIFIKKHSQNQEQKGST